MNKPRVLFFAPYGSWLVHNQADAVVAITAALKGAEVLIVRCDGLYFEGCYVLAYNADPSGGCAACQRTGDDFFKAFNLPTVQLRRYLTEDIIRNANNIVTQLSPNNLYQYRHEGAALGEVSAGSVCSYYRASPDELSQGQPEQLLRKYVRYSITTFEALKQLFDQYKPTHLFLYNGVGFSYGAAAELAKIRRVTFITHERGAHDGAFMIGSNTEAGSAKATQEVCQTWINVPLEKPELDRTKDFFRNREVGKDTNSYKFYGYTSEANTLLAALEIPRGRRILAVYTSSEYELAYYGSEYMQAARQLEILDQLFEIFAGRDDYLVVRHHPAIGLLPTGMKPQGKLLKKLYRQALRAPSNVRIIMPNERITSYSLMWLTDATLAFLSTVRLEASARGQPAASIDHPFISAGLADVIRDESRQGLTRLVDSLFERSTRYAASDLQKLYRATYACNFRHSTKFSTFAIKNGSEVDIRISSADSLDQDESLMRIIRHIFEGTSVYPEPSSSRLQASDRDELAFLDNEISAVRETRRQIKESQSAPSEPLKLTVIELSDSDTATSLSSHSLNRQRGTKATFIKANDLSCSSTLCQQIRNAESEYVVITTANCIYDGLWASAVGSMLTKAPAAGGCISGAWIQTETKKLDGAYFHSGNRANLKPATFSSEQLSNSPLVLLSLGIFRKTFLLELLEPLVNCAAHEVAEKIALVCKSPQVILFDEPAAVLCTRGAAADYYSAIGR